jgi:hypothetical protein
MASESGQKGKLSMKNYCLIRSFGFGIITVCLATSALAADMLTAQSIPEGYTVESVNLGVPFAGAIAQDPQHENDLYVSIGIFGDEDIIRLHMDTNTSETVASWFGSIGGIAVLNNGDLAIADNSDSTSDTLLRARDLNHDGDFLDPGEITQLIEPRLVGPTFTGSQMVVAPSPNSEGLPPGTLLLQTADNQTSSQLLAIADPDTFPAYIPAQGAFFSGFAFNGGVAFTPDGNLVVGSSDFPVGSVIGLVNSNGDDQIGVGESHSLGMLENSISDLAVSAESELYFTENSGTVKRAALPDNLLAGSIVPEEFLVTNTMYLSSTRLDFPSRRFNPNGSGPPAHMYIGGFVSFTAGAENLLKITPKTVTAAQDWQLFE